MAVKLNYDYDYKNDILYLYTNDKYKNSVSLYDSLIIDMSIQNRVKGIEIPEASKFFSELASKKISKDELKNITESFLDVRRVRNMEVVNFGLETQSNKFDIPVNMPNMAHI